MSDVKPALTALVALLLFAPLASAENDPIHERHELMEAVGDAAKPVGAMLRGQSEFDADVLMESLSVWKKVAGKFGGLFPEGTETGGGTEAAPAIWEDREGFDSALAMWSDAIDAAIAANPQSLEEAKPVAGKVFNACKNCHDSYRIEDE